MKIALALAMALGLLVGAITFANYLAQAIILGAVGAFIVCLLVVYCLSSKPGSGPGT